MTRPLSVTQSDGALQAAIDVARANGNRLHRNPEGWGPENLDPTRHTIEQLVPRQTVNALVAKKRMKWATWEGINGTKTPVEAELVEVLQ